MKKLLFSACALSVIGLFAGAAQATTLNPGTGILGAGGAITLPTSAIVDTLISSASSGGISAILESDVYAPDATNPLGGLTFVYTLLNAPTSDELERFNVRGYAGSAVDVGYAPASFPSSAAIRSSLAQDGGDLVGFNFQDSFGSPILGPGATAILIVHTDASGDAVVVANVIDNAGVQTTGLAPAAGTIRTPEPASLALLGLGGVMLLRRRK